MEYYSQSGEEAPLLELFADNAHTGICVEVGAYDGITYSNTLCFEKLGWTVILVEPDPALFRKILDARRARAFNVAAGAIAQEATLSVAQGAEYLSAVDPSRRHLRRIEVEKGVVREVPVRMDTLDHILEQACVERVDFVSVDVEGYELEVLRGFTLAKYRPRVVLLEDWSDLHSARDRRVFNFMRRQGYARFHRCACNDYYARLTDPVFSAPAGAYKSFRPVPVTNAGLYLGAQGARWCATRILPAPVMKKLRAVKQTMLG
jgi:FkbM family methyltransferase